MNGIGQMHGVRITRGIQSRVPEIRVDHEVMRLHVITI
jgi:hypothetical protein